MTEDSTGFSLRPAAAGPRQRAAGKLLYVGDG